MYVQKLRADNATLKINTTKLEGAVEQNEATIKQQTENFERVRDTLADVRDNRDNLQSDKDVLIKKLSEHDFDSRFVLFDSALKFSSVNL